MASVDEVEVFVRDNPGCRSSDICLALIPDYDGPSYQKASIAGAMNNKLRRLVNQKLIERVPSGDRGRVCYLYYGVD